MPRLPNSILSRRKGIESRAIADGTVLVDITSGVCYELNRMGSEIWNLLTPDTTEGHI